MAALSALLRGRQAMLAYYSAQPFLWGMPADDLQTLTAEQLLHFGEKADEQVWADDASQTHFLYQRLAWDSDLAGLEIARLRIILFTDPAALEVGMPAFLRQLQQQKVGYCVTEVPAEDVVVLQSLGQAGWQLIETRLHYVRENLTELPAARYPVRLATLADQDAIREVARGNANPYDRFHADPFFSPRQADEFVAAYAAATVAGYCDEVIVPAAAQTALDSFLAIRYWQEPTWGAKSTAARIVLTAVGPENRGWHQRLMAETLHRARARNARSVFMTTQATNGAVIHNAEKLGFRLGAVTHTLSWSDQK